MSALFKNDRKETLHWNNINAIEDLEEMLSSSLPVVLFKHSTRCIISRMALASFEDEWHLPEENCLLCYIDLLQHRDVSNKIEAQTDVKHESPQVIVLDNGKVIYSASHSAINAKTIQDKIQRK